MLVLISPAKTLDFDNPAPVTKSTQPVFLKRSAELVEEARALSPDQIENLMGVSEKIATLNHERFHNWHTPFKKSNAKQCVFAFKGDVYTGLDAETLKADATDFAQQHLRILSGLYGVLRPLDLMQAYRLEMGLKFENNGGKNLYEFWGDAITVALNKQLKSLESEVVINLASNEYFKAVDTKQLKADIITPAFKDLKNGKYKIISFYAKKARGEMARYIMEKKITDPASLKRYTRGGYRYDKTQSTAREWVFTRDEKPE